MREIIIVMLCFLGGLLTGLMLQSRADSDIIEECIRNEVKERNSRNYWEKVAKEKIDLAIRLRKQNLKLFEQLKLTNGEGNDKI